MDIELTKSAKKSIALIYREYCDRIKSGEAKGKAAYFSEKDLSRMNVGDDIPELAQNELVSPDIIGGLEFLPRGIVFMENKTPDAIKEWLLCISNFIP